MAVNQLGIYLILAIMKILRLKHRDFTLHVDAIRASEEDDTFIKTFRTAKKNHRRVNFTTKYELTGAVQQFDLWHPDEPGLQARDPAVPSYPVFFEDRYYKFVIEFAEGIVEPLIYSRIKDIKHSFGLTWTEEERYFLSGIMIFKDDIGAFDLTLSYRTGTIPQIAMFRFDVFPVKLDFKADFPIIVKGIEKGYPRLVLDYLKKTSNSFDSLSGQTDDLLWWIVFGNIYHSLLLYLKTIMENPYQSTATVFSAEKQRGNGLVIEKGIRYEGEPAKFLTIPKWEAIEDNQENRMVKFILEDISRKFNNIYKAVKKDIATSRMTVEYKAQLEFVNKVLHEMYTHPFLKQVGEFKDSEQASVVMQQHTAYSGLIAEWTRLKKAYNLFEGTLQMELRDIGYLYTIWCFFRIERILRMRLGDPYKVEKVPELLSVQLKERQYKGMNAGIAFKMKNGNIVELFHELGYTLRKNRKDHPETVKPDIVLRVRRNDRPGKIAFTCIFSASYQYAASEDLNVQPDRPWQQDLENMSHLREKIQFSENAHKTLSVFKKEWIGAYVLYPGNGAREQLVQRLQQEREELNLGGLALRPGDEQGDMVVRTFIDETLENADKVMDDMLIAYGEPLLPEDAYVFIAFVAETDTLMIDYLLNEDADQFVFRDFIQRIGDGTVRYFAPYIEGKGISCFYEITGQYWKPRREAFSPDHPLFDSAPRKCMVLRLDRKEILNRCCKVKGRINNRRFTTLKHLLNPEDGIIPTIAEWRITPK